MGIITIEDVIEEVGWMGAGVRGTNHADGENTVDSHSFLKLAHTPPKPVPHASLVPAPGNVTP